jgi:toxin ParE1/3/4
MADRIVARLEQIEMFPESGRVVPELGQPHRELIESPYRIIYRVGRSAIFVVPIVHSSRQLRGSLLR